MADDLFGWLRAVRPRTDADDEWTSSAQAAEIHAAIRDTVAARPTVRGAVTRPRIWVPVAACAAIGVTIALVVAGTGTPQQRQASSPPKLAGHLPTVRPLVMALANYDTCANLLAGLRSHAAANVQAYGFPGSPQPYQEGLGVPVPGAASVGGAPSVNADNGQAGPSAGATTSTTNDQEIGVDEPDVVKTDGDRVLTITDGMLRVLDAATGKVTGTLDLTIYDGWQGAQALVWGNAAAVILGAATTGYPGGPVLGAVAPVATPARTTMLYLDLAGHPRVTGSLRMSGTYLAARLVGSTIRFVAASTPSITFPNAAGSEAPSIASARSAVDKAPLSAWLPTYTLTTGGSSSTSTVRCDQVSHPAAYTATSMLSIYTVDLAHLGADPAPISIAADGNTVYATSTSLYVASNPDWYCCAYGESSGAPVPAPLPASGPVASPVSPAPSSTEIHRFDVSGTGRPVYLGSGTVPGRLLSQYSLSDYAGYLRVATTAGSTNGVYVLDADRLTTVGHLTGLGTGEQIYAVRFLGSVGYVVTFRQTDPLYVLDLSNPARPRVSGALQLTGYSDYLHDAGGGRLIGVGQAVNSSGIVAGLQVSLFDIRNGSAPSKTGEVVLPDSQSETSLDPHAFLYWAPSGLVAVPTQAWTPQESGKVLVLRVDGTRLTKLGVLSNPVGAAGDDGLGIQRSLIVDGALWTVSGSGVQISDQASLTRTAWVSFS